jgi:hypothetical protein
MLKKRYDEIDPVRSVHKGKVARAFEIFVCIKPISSEALSERFNRQLAGDARLRRYAEGESVIW